MPALRNKDGVVIGACDAGIPMFDNIGRRPWGPWSDRRAAVERAPLDIEIDTAPSMQDALGDWYKAPPLTNQVLPGVFTVEVLSTVRIDINSKDGREVVENLLRAADAPGGIIGRAKNGAAVVFRSTWPRRTVPYVPGADHSQRVFELASKDGSIRIKISTDSGAQRDGYKWDRDVAHHELPVMTFTAADVGTRIVKAAFELGLTWASQVDEDLAVERRVEQFKRDRCRRPCENSHARGTRRRRGSAPRRRYSASQRGA